MWRIEPEWFTAAGLHRSFQLSEDEHFLWLRCVWCGHCSVFSIGPQITPQVLCEAAAEHMAVCPYERRRREAESNETIVADQP